MGSGVGANAFPGMTSGKMIRGSHRTLVARIRQNVTCRTAVTRPFADRRNPHGWLGRAPASAACTSLCSVPISRLSADVMQIPKAPALSSSHHAGFRRGAGPSGLVQVLHANPNKPREQ